MATQTIKGKQIADETITDADIGPNAVGSSEISSTAITGQPELNPAASGDFVLVSDTDDSGNLKKVEIGNLGLGGGSSTSISDADSNTKVQVEESADENKIRFDTAGAERMIIDETGNVGIGTTDPGYNLHLASAASAVMLIDGADNTDAFLRFGQGGTLKSYIKHGSGGHLVMTNETADKDIIFNIKDGAISREGLRLNGNVAEVVVNEGSNSLVDFRVESNNHTHMLFVDGSSDNVGVGTSAPGSALHVNASFATAISGTTSDYTLTGGDHTILVDCSSGNVTLTLPTAVGCAGRMYIIKRIDGSANAANINSDGSEEIEGSSSPTSVFPMSSIVIQSDNSGWWKVAGYVSPPPP